MYSCGLFWNIYSFPFNWGGTFLSGFFFKSSPRFGWVRFCPNWGSPYSNHMAITEFQIFHGICSVCWLKRCSPGDSVFDPPVGGHLTFHKVINHNSKKVTVNCQDIYIYILYHKCIYIYIITCLFGVFTCALASRLSMPLPEVTVDPDMIQVAGGVNSKVGSFSLQLSSPKSLPIRHQQKVALYMKTAISWFCPPNTSTLECHWLFVGESGF